MVTINLRPSHIDYRHLPADAEIVSIDVDERVLQTFKCTHILREISLLNKEPSCIISGTSSQTISYLVDEMVRCGSKEPFIFKEG